MALYLNFTGMTPRVALSKKLFRGPYGPRLIENGKVGGPKRNIGVPIRVVLVINNQSVMTEMVI